MKLMISEKQFKKLMGQTENDIIEQEGMGGETTSSSYPEVGKWESGVNRDGPANQVGLTKWSDIVGAKLIRGKGNPLK